MRSKDGVVLKNAKVGVMRTREVLEVRCGVSQRVVWIDRTVANKASINCRKIWRVLR